ncbi:hypothetical protein F5051DRAFT_432142 [Lentinula edodes]|nr:hypothetical protein F5051DRAFT_432142 [Lentinula edodes]
MDRDRGAERADTDDALSASVTPKGHEPAHAAFVGKGLLTAAVSVRRAVGLVHPQTSSSGSTEEGAGTLIIIENWQDTLNFGQAKEASYSYPIYVNQLDLGPTVNSENYSVTGKRARQIFRQRTE